MKILQVTNHFYPCIGGVESVILNLSKGLAAKGHSVDVVCLNKCAYSKEELPKKAKLERINIFRIPSFDLIYYKIAQSVFGFIKDYDLIHVHGIGFFSDFLILTKIIHKKPVIISTHGGIFHTEKISLLKKFYFYVIQKALLRFADSVVAVSKSDRQLFSKICKKVLLIENGIELKKFSVLGKKKEKNTFLFVGRISKNKRIDLLISIFADVIKKMPSARLYVVGEDWEGMMPKLKELSNNLGLKKNVFFKGKASDKELLKYYDRCQFFVSASQYEGFGISAIEAMAAGCIPILNRIKAFENMVKNGQNGFLTDFTNRAESSKKILDLMNLNELEKNKIILNTKNSSKRFSWSKKVAEYSAEFEKIVSE